MFKSSGSKSHYGYGFWDQSPQVLGTWTLWAGAVLIETEATGPQQGDPVSPGNFGDAAGHASDVRGSASNTAECMCTRMGQLT